MPAAELRHSADRARTAELTDQERREALACIAERRAVLLAELAQLDAIEEGHRAALELKK